MVYAQPVWPSCSLWSVGRDSWVMQAKKLISSCDKHHERTGYSEKLSTSAICGDVTPVRTSFLLKPHRAVKSCRSHRRVC